jgi:sugar phosphate isomerase/epimerase
LAAEYHACFEYNDFYAPDLLDNPDLCLKRIGLYQSLDRDRSCDTLHGAFLDITVHSQDPLIRQVSEKRVYQSMQIAAELGVRGVVFHTGLIPNYNSGFYTRHWLQSNRRFWTGVCAAFPNLEVYLENMFDIDPEMLLQMAEQMHQVPQFGLCLDYAHAGVFGEAPEEWLYALAPYIRHMHINDNDGKDDCHDAVGDGLTDWQRFDRTIRACGIAPSVLIETRLLERQRKSLRYLQQHRIYPFGGEGG